METILISAGKNIYFMLFLCSILLGWAGAWFITKSAYRGFACWIILQSAVHMKLLRSKAEALAFLSLLFLRPWRLIYPLSLSFPQRLYL